MSSTMFYKIKKRSFFDSHIPFFVFSITMAELLLLHQQAEHPFILKNIPTTPWLVKHKAERKNTLADCLARPKFYNRPIFEVICERAIRANCALAYMK